MGGLESLAILLQSKNSFVQSCTLSVLLNCCCRNKVNCEEVVKLKLTGILVDLYVASHPVKENCLQNNAVQLISCLIHHSRDICGDIYDAGGINIFVEHLQAQSNKVKEQAVRALMKCAETTIVKMTKSDDSEFEYWYARSSACKTKPGYPIAAVKEGFPIVFFYSQATKNDQFLGT